MECVSHSTLSTEKKSIVLPLLVHVCSYACTIICTMKLKSLYDYIYSYTAIYKNKKYCISTTNYLHRFRCFLEARKNGPGKTSRMDLHILDAREKMRKKGAGTWKSSRMDLATA